MLIAAWLVGPAAPARPAVLRFPATMQQAAAMSDGGASASARKLVFDAGDGTGAAVEKALPVAVSAAGAAMCGGKPCWVAEPWLFGRGQGNYWVAKFFHDSKFLVAVGSFHLLRAAGATLACASGPRHLQLEPVPVACMRDNLPGGYPRTCGCPANPSLPNPSGSSLRILLPAAAIIVAVELQPQLLFAATVAQASTAPPAEALKLIVIFVIFLYQMLLIATDTLLLYYYY